MKTKILLLCILGMALIALQSRIFERASASTPGPAAGAQAKGALRNGESGAARRETLRNAIQQGAGLTFSVNGSGDASDLMPGDGICDSGQGVCTLRAAIQEANASGGRDTINFAIDSSLPVTINITNPLPIITSPVFIDGTSQPGFAGAPVIELNGNNILSNGLTISAGSSEILSLAINRFNLTGIVLRDTGENIVSGCFIGTDPTGNIARPNGVGIEIIDSSANFIGGAVANQRNVVSGNTGAGIRIVPDTSTFNTVVGNLIGANLAGNARLGNGGVGVVVGSAFNQIGSAFANEGNVISDNMIGVSLIDGASDNFVQGNFIGADASGTANLGNDLSGISVVGSNHVIGEAVGGGVRPEESGAEPQGLPGDTPGNIIAFNGGDGVEVLSGASNSIVGNSIFSNVGLGIDLGTDGVTPNDPGDSDSGPNGLQNFPVITSATAISDQITVAGSLNSVAGSQYRLDFYASPACDPSGFGEGQRFLGSHTVSTSTSGGATFNRTLGAAVAPGSVVTATATDILGNTSEFSQCRVVDGPVMNTDVTINKTASPNPVFSGSNLTYTITVTNASAVAASEVTVTDQLPTGTTFVSLASPGTCMTPPVGGTGQVSCQLGTLAPNGQVVLTLTVNVTAEGGSTVTNTATVATSNADNNPDNNSSTAMTQVIQGGDCTVTCPPDIVLNAPANQCSAVVNYTVTQTGDCQVVCTPPPNSTFPVGLTTVDCVLNGENSCSFNVRIVDNTPPAINCPGGIVIRPPQGQSSAVVAFPLPTVTDNCPGTAVQCQPPSGTVFPMGTSTVICTATDTSLNSGSCSFTVTIDNQAPSISCPANITVQPAGNQCATTVNYPNPVVGDDQPGVLIACVPPSGSIFPAGVTTVTCTATDRSGNTSTCSFTITNNAGPRLSGSVSLNITLGPGEPVRKPGKSRPANCSDCVEEFADFQNTGCGDAIVMLRSINRTGENVSNGRITNTDDSAFFSVAVIGNNGQSTPLPAGSSFTIPPGQGIRLRITFRPVIPPYANRTDQLAASQVLSSIIRSRMSFTTSNPFADFPVDITARVATDVKMLHPTNPRRQKTVFFQRSGDELRITYGVFDSDLNAQRARYEFFDARGRAVGETFEVDLTEAIRSQDLVAGQSFTVTQRFAGGLSNPTIASVRVTVSDPGSSDSATGQLGASASSAQTLSSILRSWGSAILLPDLWIESSEPK